jgi:hypothetical protein
LILRGSAVKLEITGLAVGAGGGTSGLISDFGAGGGGGGGDFFLHPAAEINNSAVNIIMPARAILSLRLLILNFPPGL